jgi:hypothetical protein
LEPVGLETTEFPFAQQQRRQTGHLVGTILDDADRQGIAVYELAYALAYGAKPF